MTRKSVAAAISAMLLALIIPLVPGAAEAENHGEVYLSLGTSLAAGTIADAAGNNILFSPLSYSDQLAEDLGEQHVKLGCPGETVTTFTQGGICYTGGNSQLSVAEATLARGGVDLVTIDLGANDVLQAQPEIVACGTDQLCVLTILSKIAAGVGSVLDSLRAADPDVQIVGMNYYNPNLAAWLGYYPGVPKRQAPDPLTARQSNALATLGNDLIEAQFTSRGLAIVDVEAAFSGTDFSDTDKDGIPKNVERICAWTSMCPAKDGVSPNIHANKDGYDRIADAFEKVISEHED